jgi:hypothetical protein
VVCALCHLAADANRGETKMISGSSVALLAGFAGLTILIALFLGFLGSKHGEPLPGHRPCSRSLRARRKVTSS